VAASQAAAAAEAVAAAEALAAQLAAEAAAAAAAQLAADADADAAAIAAAQAAEAAAVEAEEAAAAAAAQAGADAQAAAEAQAVQQAAEATAAAAAAAAAAETAHQAELAAARANARASAKADRLAAKVLVNTAASATSGQKDVASQTQLLLGVALLLNEHQAGGAADAAQVEQRRELRAQLLAQARAQPPATQRDNHAHGSSVPWQAAAGQIMEQAGAASGEGSGAIETAAALLQSATASPDELSQSAAGEGCSATMRLLARAEQFVGGDGLPLATAEALADAMSAALGAAGEGTSCAAADTTATRRLSTSEGSAGDGTIDAAAVQAVGQLAHIVLAQAEPGEAAVTLASRGVQLCAQRHRLASLGGAALECPLDVGMPDATALADALPAGVTTLDTQVSSLPRNVHADPYLPAGNGSNATVAPTAVFGGDALAGAENASLGSLVYTVHVRTRSGEALPLRLSDGAELTMCIPLSANRSAAPPNASVGGAVDVCAYWDEDRSVWSDWGCSALGAVEALAAGCGDGTLGCSCNHMTGAPTIKSEPGTSTHLLARA
jgi:hypothetical protein